MYTRGIRENKFALGVSWQSSEPPELDQSSMYTDTQKNISMHW
jgi:hypothetical protein